MNHTDHAARFDTLQRMGAQWYSFFEKQIWPWHQTLQGEACLVYGTGYSSWGAWAQINAALFAASTSTWDDALFRHAPVAFATRDQRQATAWALIRYALGYHTTGDFNGASNNRWGGVIQSSQEKEVYENWHSPLWMCLLAQAVFALGDEVPDDIRTRLAAAVAHDAQAQAGLGIANFDGSAQEQEGKKSHPESNAWKAALLTLARGLCPDDPRTDVWHDREIRLWTSSLAVPGDEHNEQLIQSIHRGHTQEHRVMDLVIGNHLTPSRTVIHHRFMHPCYYVFSLLPRMMAATYSGRFGLVYPPAAVRHEAEVFARLLELTMPGRIIYPAGQDWPRWVYGQAYLLPMLAHRMHADGQDYSPLMDSLIATRQRDAQTAGDGSLILHRFGNLLHDHPWTAHRYETDMIASLVWTADLLKQGDAPAGRTPQPPVKFDGRCHEPLAQTVYEQRPEGFFAMSTRAHGGSVQLTALPANNPHLLEWRSNGSMAVKLRGAAKPELVEQVGGQLQQLKPQGFAGQSQLHFGGGPSFNLNPAQYVGHVAVHAMTDAPVMLVYQQLTATSHGFVDRINLHVWRIAQSVHNHSRRLITSMQGSHTITLDQHVELNINSPWVCVDESLCLSLLPVEGAEPAINMNGEVASPLQWTLRQIPAGPAATRMESSGSAWLELSVQMDRPGSLRTKTGEVLAVSAMAVSLDGQPVQGRCSRSADQIHFNLQNPPQQLHVACSCHL